MPRVIQALNRARRAAEGLMTDAGRIERLGEPVFNPDTGLVETSRSTVYDGKLNVRKPSTEELTKLFGETQVTVLAQIVCVPHDTYGVKVDDVVTLYESQNPDVLDVEFKVVGVPRNSHVPYIGLLCDVVEE